ncbi:hypothetical protein E8E95_06505 [Pseudomonas sp. BN414]|uniref:hypothetical protein n=1 Tax=Pseudomonas sp. BN414 TaxID=2567888 RepID=UPI0024548354|nr:hypothetical protein [Pseudomonas sp. BN414]MDH4566325.1 hypothetical protein [Pseudomonas sp. BN414]
MVDACDWPELQRLAQNLVAAHISMVAFLEVHQVPWSEAQAFEFARLAAVRAAALDEYTAYFESQARRESL